MELRQSVTSVPVTIYVPEEVHKALMELAAYTGKSLSDLAQGAFAIGFPQLAAVKRLMKKNNRKVRM